MEIQLSDRDRERLGCPETIDCSARLTLREGIALEEATGRDSADLIEAMRIVVKRVEFGGKPMLRGYFTADGARLLVWLGLRRAGIDVVLAELDFDATMFLTPRLVEPEAEGKGPGSPPAEPATPSGSPSTGRTRSKKSTTSK